MSGEYAAIERLDESLLVTGLGWREAASISNEADRMEYAVAYRLEMARMTRERMPAPHRCHAGCEHDPGSGHSTPGYAANH